jgi:hypothetical protein
VQVRDLASKSYRLLKDNLDKDIVPNQSKFIVKKVSMNYSTHAYQVFAVAITHSIRSFALS